MKATATDERGAEFGVEENTGQLTKVEWPAEGKRNAAIEIKVDGFRYPVKGWVDTEDDAMRAVLTSHHGQPVAFRIEIHRKDTIDAALPLDQVDKFDKFRRVVALRPANTSDSPRPTAPSQGDRPVANEPPPAPGPKPNEQPAAPPAPRSGGELIDTWGYTATLGCVEHAFDLLFAAKNEGTIAEVSPSLLRFVADLLLESANSAQAAVRNGAIDVHANSHTRARGAVRCVVDTYPPPIGAPVDDESWTKWQTRVAGTAARLMSTAVDMLAEVRP